MSTDTVVYQKMDPVIKERWLKELRSGNIKQGKNSLRDTLGLAASYSLYGEQTRQAGVYQYCCIGVLCNVISHRKDWVFERKEGNYKARWYWRGFDATSNIFDELPGKPIDPSAALFLSRRNDDEHGGRWDFNQIADWVEVNL